MSSQQPQKNINFGRSLFIGSQLGILIALPMVICIAGGIYLDSVLNSAPLMLLICIFLGMGLTIIDVYKIVLPFLEKKLDEK